MTHLVEFLELLYLLFRLLLAMQVSYVGGLSKVLLVEAFQQTAEFELEVFDDWLWRS